MKNDSRTNKEKYYIVKKVFSILIIVAVLASCICVYAEDQSGMLEFPIGPGTYTLMDRPGMTSLQITVTSGVCYVVCAPRYSSGYFYIMNGDNSNIRNFTLNISDDISIYNYYSDSNQAYYYTFFCGQYSNFDTATVYCPRYGGENRALEALVDMYEAGPGGGDDSDTGYPLNYTLPAGNIAYLEIDNSTFNGVNLATIMPELSGIGSGDPWSLSSQFYAMSDSMLDSGDSVYDLNGTRIVWNKSSHASTNLLGQTDHAVWESEGPYPNKKYFVICNPFYFFDNENNGSITIIANGIKNVYVQPLKTIVQQNGNEITYNTTVDGGTYEGTVTDDLGPIEWTDPDGGSTAPGTSTSNTPVTGVNQFQQWLQGILQQIISVFEPAHDAITTLASAVQNFSGWLKALYVWLPSPVLNLLTSAISLAIIIGVIKVFI